MRVAEGPVGMHSNWKWPSTRSRCNGCSKDDVDHRGRWHKKRVSDCCVDINLPHPDAKVVAALCIGGPCKCALKQGSGVSMLWLCEHVVPHLVASAHMQDQVVIVLAKPILWACFDDSMERKCPMG